MNVNKLAEEGIEMNNVSLWTKAANPESLVIRMMDTTKMKELILRNFVDWRCFR